MNTYIIDEEKASIAFLKLKEMLEHSDPPMTVKLATGCPLCNTIWSSKEAYQNFIDNPWKEKVAIVMYHDKPYLYSPIPMDDYYSDIVTQINFCPKCGRKLVEE